MARRPKHFTNNDIAQDIAHDAVSRFSTEHPEVVMNVSAWEDLREFIVVEIMNRDSID